MSDASESSLDPLSEVVALLRPEARTSKLVEASGLWGVRRSELGRPFYCAVLEGHVRLAVPGEPEEVLCPGGVELIPEAQDFEASSAFPPARRLDPDPVMTGLGRVRLGETGAAPDTRLVVGYCRFGSPDAQVLVGLLPRWRWRGASPVSRTGAAGSRRWPAFSTTRAARHARGATPCCGDWSRSC